MLKLDNEKLRSLFFIAILLLVAPVAIELIFVAQIVGAEVAVLFFLGFLKHQWQVFEAKLECVKVWLGSVLAITSVHAISNPKIFYAHAMISVGVFAVTGSMFYVTAIWYPVVVAGGALGVG